MNSLRALLTDYEPRTLTYSDAPLTPAAVAILIHRRRSTVLFMTRSAALKTHSGQVGLPGGRIEEGESTLEAALRETEEEVGLRPENVELLGPIDRQQTITDFLVHPFVCSWEQEQDLIPDPAEVANIFEVPLDWLLDPRNVSVELWSRAGQSRRVYFWEYNTHVIWGVTGRVLASFFQVATGQSLAELAQERASRQADFMKRFGPPRRS